jgi:hypothetical protein
MTIEKESELRTALIQFAAASEAIKLADPEWLARLQADRLLTAIVAELELAVVAIQNQRAATSGVFGPVEVL